MKNLLSEKKQYVRLQKRRCPVLPLDGWEQRLYRKKWYQFSEIENCPLIIDIRDSCKFKPLRTTGHVFKLLVPKRSEKRPHQREILREHRTGSLMLWLAREKNQISLSDVCCSQKVDNCLFIFMVPEHYLVHLFCTWDGLDRNRQPTQRTRKCLA